MLGKTHAAAGFVAAAAVLYLMHAPASDLTLGIGGGVVAALLPDIDEPHSLFNHYAKVIGPAIGSVLKHRTITHTLVVAAAVTVGLHLLFPHLPIDVVAAIGGGYVSHLVADSITPEGVMWFWPLSSRRLSFTGWLPGGLWRVFTTGGGLELMVFRPLFLLGGMYLTGAVFWPWIHHFIA